MRGDPYLAERWITIALAALVLIGTSCGGGDGGNDTDEVVQAVCGNGVQEVGEECDGGSGNITSQSTCDPGVECCTSSCTEIIGPRRVSSQNGECGDGVINEPQEEECDDGNRNCIEGSTLPGDEKSGPQRGGGCPQADSNPCCDGLCERPFFNPDAGPGHQWECPSGFP
jgi:hypothetical protein